MIKVTIAIVIIFATAMVIEIIALIKIVAPFMDVVFASFRCHP